MAVGAVPVGHYTLYALPDGATAFVQVGELDVKANASLAYACAATACVAVP